MTNINLTEKETILMTAFASLVDEDTAAAQMEAGPVFATADELSRFAEMEVKSVKSVTSSLVKKGVVIKNEAEDRYELTEAGVTWAYDQREETAVEAAEPALTDEDGINIVTSILREELSKEGATKCSALRAAAADCKWTRAVFIKAASIVGINSGTAARQWQEGRADEAPKAASEDVKEKAVAYLMTLAPDEVISILMEKMTAKAVKEIAALSE